MLARSYLMENEPLLPPEQFLAISVALTEERDILLSLAREREEALGYEQDRADDEARIEAVAP